MIALIGLDLLNSVFNTIKYKNRFAIYTPGPWEDLETFTKLKDLIEYN